MNRLERKRQQWLESHSSPATTYSGMRERGIAPHPVLEKFLADLRKCKEGGKTIAKIAGIFGPEHAENHAGYLEEVIHPPEGGTLLKIYGCSYLYKGNASNNVVYILQFPKHVLSQVSRDIIGSSVLYSLAVGLRFLFQRKKFIQDLESLFWEIDWKVVRHCQIKDEEYNELQKEIERTANLAAKGTRWEKVVKHAVKFIKVVFFVDNAYRFRFQDSFGETNNQAPDKIKELFRVFDILLRREQIRSENSAEGLKKKWKFVILTLKILLFFDLELRGIAKKFIENLDTTKVKMDTDDWYFSLKFKSYNFGGLSPEKREKLWEQANHEKEHIFLI